MLTLRHSLLPVLALGLLGASHAQVKKVLVLDYRFGSSHNEGRPLNLELIRTIGTESGFTVEASGDQSAVTADYLSGFQAVVWNNVSQNGASQHTKKALWQSYLEGGGALLALHASGDTRTGTWTWFMEGQLDAKYNLNHNPEGTRADVWIHTDAVAPNGQFHPILKGQDKFFTSFTPAGTTAKRWAQVWADEWYNWDQAPDPAKPGLTVLLELDDNNRRGVVNFSPLTGKKDFHPMAWTRADIGAGKGRLAFIVTGHGREIHASRDKGLKELWKNAIQWVAKQSTGCMTATASNYNPWVDKDDGSCVGVAVAPKAEADPLVSADAGLSALTLARAGSFRVALSDAAGREVFAGAVTGPGKVKLDAALPKGAYFVSVREGGREVVKGLRVEKR